MDWLISALRRAVTRRRHHLGGLVATYASVPRNITDPLESLPIYTSLFNKLGIAALVCTAIAIAALPLMNRLSQAHHEGGE